MGITKPSHELSIADSHRAAADALTRPRTPETFPFTPGHSPLLSIRTHCRSQSPSQWQGVSDDYFPDFDFATHLFGQSIDREIPCSSDARTILVVSGLPKERANEFLPPDPTDLVAYEKALAEQTIGKPQPLTARIEILDYDPTWPHLYEREAARIRSILNDRVVRIEHVGSTSVPGLPAKSIIDIALEVPDSADEAAYVPDMEVAGYVLRAREPDWFQHRFFKGPVIDINLHTFSAGCAEVDRMLVFRDWLRADAADRELYLRTKRDLAGRDWQFMQQYADAKTAVVKEIMARAEAAGR